MIAIKVGRIQSSEEGRKYRGRSVFLYENMGNGSREKRKYPARTALAILLGVCLMAVLWQVGQWSALSKVEAGSRKMTWHNTVTESWEQRLARVETTVKEAEEKKQYLVVLDAGHGGDDPGKIGINQAKEKDINLKITYLVKQYLEASDVQVVLTREDEGGLYDQDASNKKVQDMKRRIEVMEKAAPDVAVSIHQNSYPEEYVHGAQVFFYHGSREGEALAERIQNRLVQGLDPENHRQIKANDSYYLLKKTAVPIVIVECGFLSNREEAQKLCDEDYQKKIAWQIHLGIMQYLNGRKLRPIDGAVI